MRRGALAGGVALCVVAVIAVVAGWLARAPALDRADARELTRRVLGEAGFDDVAVSADVIAARHQPAAGGDPVDVWRTVASVDSGGTVVLDVDRHRGRAVYLDDLTADGTSQLLDDAQYRTVDDYRYNPPLDERLRRNGFASVAALAIVGVAVLLVLHVHEHEET
jgi:hypothetical protein